MAWRQVGRVTIMHHAVGDMDEAWNFAVQIEVETKDFQPEISERT
jgi:hypothetical protein